MSTTAKTFVYTNGDKADRVAENVAYAAGANPTAAEFKALIDALVAAGLMKAAST